ncbi:hypothetical protein [Chengkuizengella axinellae]|uniref:DUF3139 domain-containing protein n=1 Tax=Chengkuizengella axinellae TaxID=3064388 RepID=A0ABT9J6D5_9BACL|nr:hypothetical protein [Chengkuizengella sp. 2205SS18-9]MDP5277195.1 hypothetical protein [Chengkuizengella sp. 2205SS18-9]
MSTKTKIFTIIFTILVIAISISLVVGFQKLKDLHLEEIGLVITSMEGKVIEVDEVNPVYSPYEDESDRSNIIYKITYEKSGEQLIAWYRAINQVNNIHDETFPFGEEWIFEENE